MSLRIVLSQHVGPKRGPEPGLAVVVFILGCNRGTDDDPLLPFVGAAQASLLLQQKGRGNQNRHSTKCWHKHGEKTFTGTVAVGSVDDDVVGGILVVCANTQRSSAYMSSATPWPPASNAAAAFSAARGRILGSKAQLARSCRVSRRERSKPFFPKPLRDHGPNGDRLCCTKGAFALVHGK